MGVTVGDGVEMNYLAIATVFGPKNQELLMWFNLYPSPHLVLNTTTGCLLVNGKGAREIQEVCGIAHFLLFMLPLTEQLTSLNVGRGGIHSQSIPATSSTNTT